MTTTNIVRKPSGVIDFDAYKGLEGSIGLTGMTFTVKVIDARQSFGRLDLCVEPLHGEGSRWMEYRKVELKSKPVRSEITTTEVTTVRGQVAQRAIEASRGNGSSNTDLIQQLLNQINNGKIATQTKETIK